MSPTKPQTETQKATLPKTKVTAMARLKTLGSSFSQRRKPAPSPIVFPPPSWVLNDEEVQSAGLPATFNSSHAPSTQPLAPPEPVTFAMTLKSLIESLPMEGPWTDKPSEGTSKDKGNQPAPQPVPSGLDSDLVRLLASEDVMNGSRVTPTDHSENSKSNIWNILAGLKNKTKVTGSSESTAVEAEEDGLMMYSPLEPQADSQVELATPETVVRPAEDLPPRSTLTPAPILKDRSNPTRKEIEQHVWVPSTTELSVLTTWWGYRIYLPPPVMAKLDGKAIKATTRAAMIATALKWLLERIPLAIIPPQFRVAVKLLKQLTPLTGYIGVFIAWSWDRVRALDEGMLYPYAGIYLALTHLSFFDR